MSSLRGRGLAVYAAAILVICWPGIGTGHSPNLDFEFGFIGWSRTGDAFDHQPIDASAVDTTVAAPVSLGGDYWKGLPYPLGQSGRYLVRSTERGTGTMTSTPFMLPADARVVSVLVGGEPDPRRARVEFQVAAPTVADIPLEGNNEAYVVEWRTAGRGRDQLSLSTFEIPARALGRLARIRVVDAVDDGHILVDRIAVGSDPPGLPVAPVWGLADSHTHPMTHLGFGGLSGTRAVWGAPGGAVRDYIADPMLIVKDIPRCVRGHAGGPTAEIFINAAEGRFTPTGNGFHDFFRLLAHGLHHPSRGAPGFENFPSFRSGAHQQMHVTQIHRAWRGGLRLMSALAVHNRGLEFLMSPVVDGRTTTTSERAVLEAQVCGMRELARLNDEWLEIASSPSDARQIIGRGKLAVVLGVEMDQLGALDGFGSPRDEVQYLWDLGIRQVTPVHAVDNRIGGAAVFEPVYNSLNDLLNRDRFDARSHDLTTPPTFFEIRDAGCREGGPPAGECVRFRLSPVQQRAVLSRQPFSGFRLTPFFTAVRAPAYEGVQGMMNRRGLTELGREYVSELMRQGMLIGLEHMSQQSVADAYAVVADNYPMIASHAHFRRLSLQHQDDTVAAYLPSEYEISDSDVDRMRRRSGFLGQFVAEQPIEYPVGLPAPPFPNDCGGSSKTFGYSLWYALHKMGGSGVGIATDFTIIDGTAPRFGPQACWASRPIVTARGRLAPMPDQYGRPQQDGVRYASRPVQKGVRAGMNAPLEPYSMGTRTYDFNVDGLAHYGLLPDLLQDLKNVGMSKAAFAAIFSSAESFIRTWERITDVSPPRAHPFASRPLACDRLCRGMCPQ